MGLTPRKWEDAGATGEVLNVPINTPAGGGTQTNQRLCLSSISYTSFVRINCSDVAGAMIENKIW